MTDIRQSDIEYTPPVPPVLKLNGREIAVDESPVATSVDDTRIVRILIDTPDELVIGPNSRSVFRAAMVAAGIVFGGIGLTLLAMWDAPIWVKLIVIGIGFILAGAMVRTSLRWLWWLRFDRRAGRLVCERRVGFSPRRVTNWELPLNKVVAVQLLYNGSHTVTETTGGDQPTTTTRRFYGYEINLVLDDPDRRRVHLYSLADWEWIRATGSRIGAYLGVPVIDKLHHGG